MRNLQNKKRRRWRREKWKTRLRWVKVLETEVSSCRRKVNFETRPRFQQCRDWNWSWSWNRESCAELCSSLPPHTAQVRGEHTPTFTKESDSRSADAQVNEKFHPNVQNVQHFVKHDFFISSLSLHVAGNTRQTKTGDNIRKLQSLRLEFSEVEWPCVIIS